MPCAKAKRSPLLQWLKDDAAPVLPPPSQKHLALLQGRVKRLEQMLEDLLSNAIKHHHQPQTGQVQVRVQDQGEWLEFQIRSHVYGHR